MNQINRRDDHDQPLLNEEPSVENDVELTALNYERSSNVHRKIDHGLPKGSVPPVFITILVILIVLAYVINSEAAAYVEDGLGWKKPFAMFYLSHSSIMLPWFFHTIYLRWKDRRIPFRRWFPQYLNELRESISTVETYAQKQQNTPGKNSGQAQDPIKFLAITMIFATLAVTLSGLAYFFSIALTTPADLNAIYNCATFFAAAFSVPILKERLSKVCMAAVALSILGTLVITYGDATGKHADSVVGSARVLGNLIACAGTIGFGLYEVLMKKWTTPSGVGRPAESSVPLTMAATALVGFYTLTTFWVVLIVLHITGVETLVIPNAYTTLWILITVLSASFSIALLVMLVVWTDPVFGSMANVLTVFFVAIADWIVWGLKPSLATYVGGAIIFIAFGLLSHDSIGTKMH